MSRHRRGAREVCAGGESGLDIVASRRARLFLHVHARGVSRRGVSDTLFERPGACAVVGLRARDDRLGASDRHWREPGMTILLIYSRLWPDPG